MENGSPLRQVDNSKQINQANMQIGLGLAIFAFGALKQFVYDGKMAFSFGWYVDSFGLLVVPFAIFVSGLVLRSPLLFIKWVDNGIVAKTGKANAEESIAYEAMEQVNVKLNSIEVQLKEGRTIELSLVAFKGYDCRKVVKQNCEMTNELIKKIRASS